MELLTLIGLIVVVYSAVYILLLFLIDCDVGLWYADHFGNRLGELPQEWKNCNDCLLDSVSHYR